MLKKFAIGFFVTYFSLTSVLALAETSDDNIKTRSASFALIQGDGKYTIRSTNDRDKSELIAELNAGKTQHSVVKPEANNTEQSGWLLAFALIGFVMLSNRRGV